MTTLVTGSTGHLGEALVRTLKARSEPVRGIDVNSSTHTDVVGSITDRDLVTQAMQGVRTVFHTATLHKPHVATHSKADFINSNVTGTLVLLEAALAAGVREFVFTSTTSLFGDALRPPPGAPAAWITEDVVPIPKNIYGVTKSAAEDLCLLFHRNHGMNCIILRTSRFFPEDDDSRANREEFSDQNLKANEFLYRRADIEDIVEAHLLARKHGERLGFGRYIISATSPLTEADLPELNDNAPAVVARHFPDYEALYETLGWRMNPRLDRVYVNAAARQDLGWTPRRDFAHVLKCLAAGEEFVSPLALSIGRKGYHDVEFEDGPFPVEDG